MKAKRPSGANRRICSRGGFTSSLAVMMIENSQGTKTSGRDDGQDDPLGPRKRLLPAAEPAPRAGASSAARAIGPRQDLRRRRRPRDVSGDSVSRKKRSSSDSARPSAVDLVAEVGQPTLEELLAPAHQQDRRAEVLDQREQVRADHHRRARRGPAPDRLLHRPDAPGVEARSAARRA